MGRIAIFTEDPGWHGQQLSVAFIKLGYSCDFVSLTECRFAINSTKASIILPGYQENLPDAVFVRGVPGGSLEEVVFYLDILHALKILEVPVYNDARSIERSVDKAMTSFMLKTAGIKTPDTWVLRDRTQALALVENELKKGNTILSKPLFGSQGEGIRLIEKTTDLLWLASSHGIYYLQRFVPSFGIGFSDIRVFVINGHVIAAMLRRGRSWLNNVAQGAICETIELNSTLYDLAVQTTSILKLDYAGIDIIKDKAGEYWVIEVNSVPAWKGLQSVSHVNIADQLAKDLIYRCTNKLPIQAISENCSRVC